MLLALETSCDETAAAVFDVSSFITGDGPLMLAAESVISQAQAHQPFGGVVPELAAREHLRNLPFVVEDVLRRGKLSVQDLTKCAVTIGPGLKGCLLTGIAYAQGLSFARKLELIPVNHLEGHLVVSELLIGEPRITYPCIALLVSGGHTQLVWIKRFREYQILAQTRDDAAGEAFDKIATLLQLPYPGGPELSKAAEHGRTGEYLFPQALAADENSFSFSGLKTAVLRFVEKNREKQGDKSFVADVARAAETAIVEMLVQKSLRHCQQKRPNSFLLTGGVAANRVLRQVLAEKLKTLDIPLIVPPQRWCTDNAAMIGACAALISREKKGRAVAEKDRIYSLTAKPSFPLIDLEQL